MYAIGTEREFNAYRRKSGRLRIIDTGVYGLI